MICMRIGCDTQEANFEEKNCDGFNARNVLQVQDEGNFSIKKNDKKCE